MKTDFTREIIAENRAIFFLFADKFNHFLDIAERFIQRFSLCIATGQERTFNNIHPPFISLNDHRK